MASLNIRPAKFDEVIKFFSNAVSAAIDLRKKDLGQVKIFHNVVKVLRPSDPNYWKNVEWISYVFCKEYCSECQTNRVLGQQFGTITFCHL